MTKDQDLTQQILKTLTQDSTSKENSVKENREKNVDKRKRGN